MTGADSWSSQDDWNDPKTTSWQTVSAGAWSQDDWYGRPPSGPRYKLGCLPVESLQQAAEREEQWRNESRAALQLALTQPGHCPAVAHAKLQEVLAVCEADKLPEEELAEAKRELHVRKQARAQALEQERQEIDADMARRHAAMQAEEEHYRVQREERRRALLKGDEADTPEEHHVELTAAAEKPSREVIA